MPLVAPLTSTTKIGPGGPGVRLCASPRDPRSTPASPSQTARRPERIKLLPFPLSALGPILPHPLGHGFPRRRRHLSPATPATRFGHVRHRRAPSASEKLGELGANRRFLLLQLFEPRNGAQTSEAPELLRIQSRHRVLQFTHRVSMSKHPFSIISARARRQ